MRGANVHKTARARHLRRAQTDAEKKLRYKLKNRQLAGHKFVRQEPIGRYVADFVCRERKVIIELDGSQHADSEHDHVRDAYLVSCGYRVMRFWNNEVMTNLDGILETIFAALDEHPCALAVSVRGSAPGEGACPEEPHPEPPPRAGRGDDAS